MPLARSIYIYLPIVVLSWTACRGALTEHQIDVAGATYHVVSQGAGDALLFVHGGNLDSRIWHDEMKHFSHGYLTIAYDLKGHGQTTNGNDTLESHEVLQTILDYFDIREATIVGHSLGAVVAVDFAVKHPQYCKKLVLAAPGLLGWKYQDTEVLKSDSIIWSAIQSNDSIGAFREFSRRWGPMRASERSAMIMRTNFAQHLQDPKPLLTSRVTQALPHFSRPSLILIGGRDNTDIQQIARFYTSAIPKAKIIEFPNAGHLIHVDEPDLFNTVITDFLQ